MTRARAPHSAILRRRAQKPPVGALRPCPAASPASSARLECRGSKEVLLSASEGGASSGARTAQGRRRPSSHAGRMASGAIVPVARQRGVTGSTRSSSGSLRTLDLTVEVSTRPPHVCGRVGNSAKAKGGTCTASSRARSTLAQPRPRPRAEQGSRSARSPPKRLFALENGPNCSCSALHVSWGTGCAAAPDGPGRAHDGRLAPGGPSAHLGRHRAGSHQRRGRCSSQGRAKPPPTRPRSLTHHDALAHMCMNCGHVGLIPYRRTPRGPPPPRRRGAGEAEQLGPPYCTKTECV